MSKREAHVVVLDEDRQHTAFLSRLLQGLGVQRRRIRFLPPPADKSGGVGYVLDQYPDRVREHRRKAAHQGSLRLVVMVDADDATPDQRLRELDKRLELDGQAKRDAGEKIIVLVPRRNIETWIRWLEGNPVTEEEAYPKYTGAERKCQEAVQRLVELLHSGGDLPQDCPPSLRVAVEELRKL
jgi:hypothetical protein